MIFHTLLQAPKVFYPEDSFKIGLLRNNAPLLASAILSRVPINIVDRFIAIFGGYGVSLLYRLVVYFALCCKYSTVDTIYNKITGTRLPSMTSFTKCRILLRAAV